MLVVGMRIFLLKRFADLEQYTQLVNLFYQDQY